MAMARPCMQRCKRRRSSNPMHGANKREHETTRLHRQPWDKFILHAPSSSKLGIPSHIPKGECAVPPFPIRSPSIHSQPRQSHTASDSPRSHAPFGCPENRQTGPNLHKQFNYYHQNWKFLYSKWALHSLPPVDQMLQNAFQMSFRIRTSSCFVQENLKQT